MPSIRPPRGDAEGLPTVLVEAQSSGLPAVCFESGGIAEGMIHGQTGILVPERDRDGMARGILQLLSDRQAWLNFSAGARQLALRRFDIRTQTRLLEALYDEARTRACATQAIASPLAS
jgi:glycosyltransferase involved in cell wall biosynthesis